MTEEPLYRASIEFRAQVEARYRGKLWCYVAVARGDRGQLAVAIANQSGYFTPPFEGGILENHPAALIEASRINSDRGIDERMAALIVMSTATWKD